MRESLPPQFQVPCACHFPRRLGLVIPPNGAGTGDEVQWCHGGTPQCPLCTHAGVISGLTQGTRCLSTDLQTPAPAQPHYHAVVTTSFTLGL